LGETSRGQNPKKKGLKKEGETLGGARAIRISKAVRSQKKYRKEGEKVILENLLEKRQSFGGRERNDLAPRGKIQRERGKS